MIENIIEDYFVKNKKLDIEHKDSLYVTHAACNKLIGKGITKLHGNCPRATYYSCIGASEIRPNNGRGLSRKLGDYTELLILNIFKNTDTLVEKGTKFELEDINVKGRIDAIIEMDDEQVGVEIKSLSSNKWANNHIFGSKWDNPQPKIQHLLQCMIYLYAFKSTLNKFILFYVRRDNGAIKEFTIELALIKDKLYPVIDGVVDWSLTYEDIVDNYKYVKECINNNIVPKRGYSLEYAREELETLRQCGYITKFMYDKYEEKKFGDMECLGCGYRDMCIKDGDK